MEQGAIAERPESPKKKIKSTYVADSAARASEQSNSNRPLHYPPASTDINGIAPTRKHRRNPIPDSSTEYTCSNDKSPSVHTPANDKALRVQEEEVSSSENSTRITSYGNVNANLREVEEEGCDSPSSNINNTH